MCSMQFCKWNYMPNKIKSIQIWYQWKGDVHIYTLVVNLGLYDLQYWLSGRGCNNLRPSENM